MNSKNIFILLTFLTIRLFSQDTTVAWLQNIDTLNYKIYFNKKEIPAYILKYMEVDKLSEIANPGKKYSAGCVGRKGAPFNRLNWVAKDKKKHCVVSISHGGKFHGTWFYYLDYDIANKININEISFGHERGMDDWSFGLTTRKIKAKEFEFEEYEDPDKQE